jgi:hypothetical protein
MTHEQLADALADRYLLDEELGRGSSATVYLAQDLRHGRRVALKVLHSALGQATRGRAVSARDPHPGTAAPPAHPAGVRLRRRRGPPLLRHAARRDRDPAGPARAPGPADRGRRGPGGPRGGVRPELRARPGCDSPRPQARKHRLLTDGPRDPRRFRHRGGRGRHDWGPAPHRDRRGRGHAGLHESRAERGRRSARRPQRSVFAGRGHLRGAFRRTAVHRPQRARHLRAEAHRNAAAHP